ncbi:uncharacterized protein VTP21DRAFT_3032 [Calcarisporiella thermophila]|uniref:uncharacterized protein n=1 Tax=Calcarisporiella thermophila TaxID=911321 RepID=UPI00374428B0
MNRFVSSPTPELNHHSHLYQQQLAPSVEAIRASLATVPEGYYPEFHQYNHEQSMAGGRKRSRAAGKVKTESQTTSVDEMNANNDHPSLSSAELRRQTHIQSEQKRRAEIKDGFEILRKQLPGCINKKLSKAALLQKTIQHLQHLQRIQRDLLVTADRMARENQELRSRLQEALLYTNTTV